jgi:hypothetical protein
MNNQDSINGFFYNLIPGILFIFGLLYLLDDKFSWITSPIVKDNSVLITFLAIILGLFFGFVFQGIAKFKWLRSNVEDLSRLTVLDSNDKIFQKAVAELSEIKRINVKKVIDSKEIDLRKKFFYLMYNYLRGTRHADTVMFFTDRSSLWSNLYYGGWIYFFSFIIAFLIKFFSNSYATYVSETGIAASICFGIMVLIYLSYYMLVEHLRIFNEVTLLTYITLIKHQKKLNKEKK